MRLTEVRRAQVCKVAVQGDQDTVGALLDLLEDTSAELRVSVANALRQLARKGKADNVVKRLLSVISFDTDDNVRIAAIGAACEVANRGDVRVVRALCNVAVGEGGARLAATKGIAEVAGEGDALAIEACLQLSEDADAALRLEAVQILGTISGKQHEHCVIRFLQKLDREKTNEAFPPSYVTQKLGDTSNGKHVRNLGLPPPPGDEEAISAPIRYTGMVMGRQISGNDRSAAPSDWKFDAVAA